jgi:glutamate formiminotransferase/formiminotetrahydrofolate cyclodeaminase
MVVTDLTDARTLIAEIGYPVVLKPDAGVGALALRTCISGACLNVMINAVQLDDSTLSEDIVKKATEIESDAIREERSIYEMVKKRIKSRN